LVGTEGDLAEDPAREDRLRRLLLAAWRGDGASAGVGADA